MCCPAISSLLPILSLWKGLSLWNPKDTVADTHCSTKALQWADMDILGVWPTTTLPCEVGICVLWVFVPPQLCTTYYIFLRVEEGRVQPLALALALERYELCPFVGSLSTVTFLKMEGGCCTGVGGLE